MLYWQAKRNTRGQSYWQLFRGFGILRQASVISPVCLPIHCLSVSYQPLTLESPALSVSQSMHPEMISALSWQTDILAFTNSTIECFCHARLDRGGESRPTPKSSLRCVSIAGPAEFPHCQHRAKLKLLPYTFQSPSTSGPTANRPNALAPLGIAQQTAHRRQALHHAHEVS